ncbi:MAG: protease [Myxococcales bacterium]|nr:protease [Myxococcales bacterium]
MNTTTNTIIAVLGCAVLGGACVGEVGDPELDETVDNLVKAGFPRADIRIHEGAAYVGNDAKVSLAASREMIRSSVAAGSREQYRTSNLVSRNVRSICIRGHADARFDGAAVGVLAQGANLAMANYNELNLVFTMRFVGEGQSTAGCDAIIEATVVDGFGGVAGFPENGLPFGNIEIGIGLASFGVDVAEHVITHELGHAVGFRHSDFYDRSISCGGASVDEGQDDVGAIHIPGTPTDAEAGGSLMNSCFRAQETGEFAQGDIVALRLGYGL